MSALRAWGKADMDGGAAPTASVAEDPKRTTRGGKSRGAAVLLRAIVWVAAQEGLEALYKQWLSRANHAT